MKTSPEFKCPCCGGAIVFHSAAQKLKCPYCDTEFEIDTLKAYDEQLREQPAEDLSWNNSAGTAWEEGETAALRTYCCHSCGGELVTDGTTAATACPYCNSPVVLTERFGGGLKPDYVIPFKLDRQAAKRALLQHYKGKRLMPKIFRQQNHIEEIKGVYVPFWLFDADVDASIRYKTTKVRMWSDSKYNYTETRFFSVERAGRIGFTHLPVDGSQKMADDLMEAIEPFDFSEAVDFQTAYLAGYFADRYDVSAEQSESRANERIRHSTEQAFADTVQGYATVIPESTQLQFHDTQAKYALYPVWLLNTTWKGQRYTFAMNGQTGKMVGDLPLDRGAYFRWLAGLTGVFGAVSFAALYLLYLL